LYETQKKDGKLNNVDAFTEEDMYVLFLHIARILRKILMRFVSIITVCPDGYGIVGLKQAVETKLK